MKWMVRVLWTLGVVGLVATGCDDSGGDGGAGSAGGGPAGGAGGQVEDHAEATCDTICSRLATCDEGEGAGLPETVAECLTGCVATWTAERAPCSELPEAATCDQLLECVAATPPGEEECRAGCERLELCGESVGDLCFDECVLEETPWRRRCVVDAPHCADALACL